MHKNTNEKKIDKLFWKKKKKEGNGPIVGATLLQATAFF